MDYKRILELGTMPKSKVLGIGGSPRKGGNSEILLESILDGVREKNISTESIQLRDYQFQGCIGCEKCRKDKICTRLKDGMSLIYPYFLESKGIVLVSPNHNSNITSWMKAFFDRLYCFYDYDDNRNWTSRLSGQGRKAVVAAVCEQDEKSMGFTIEAMEISIEPLGYEIVGKLAVSDIFERGKIKDNSAILSEAQKIGHDLAESLM